MGMLLRQTGLRWAVSRYWDTRPRRLLAPLLAVATLLALLFFIGHRWVQPSLDRLQPLRAEIARLEAEISQDASDVASLRLMADQARAELASLREQKQQAALANPTGCDHAVAVPGTDQPFNTGPAPAPAAPLPQELVVNAPRRIQTARDYLMEARRHIAAGRSGAASDALERAETRLLNGASGATQDLRRAMLVRQIGDARHLLATGDSRNSATLIDAAIQSFR